MGMCIITDDVYGDSLRKLISEKKVTEEHLRKVCHELVEAMEYIEANHLVHQPIRPETIQFTENIGNLKLIDVGFDQKQSLKPDDVEEDIRQFGHVLTETLDAMGSHNPRLRTIASQCLSKGSRISDQPTTSTWLCRDKTTTDCSCGFLPFSWSCLLCWHGCHRATRHIRKSRRGD